ncbi:hypothetical protein quinque_004222 [Culex quinquefasciatus]
MKLLLLLCLISASVVLGKPLDEADAQGSNEIIIQDVIEDEKLQMLQNLKKATKKYNRMMMNLLRRQNRKRMHKRNNRKRIHKNLLKSRNLIMTKNNKTLRMKKPKNLLRNRNLRNRKRLVTKKTLKKIVRNLLVHQSIPTMGMESPTTGMSHHVLDRDTIIIPEDLGRSSIRFEFQKVT